ncbi:hypothetical protein B0H66DRAFT_592158 [Apodospora peruviana]|uniref:Uncharacterized protein n=1 Tax=Apodospora peruviana TaxID=516989 RepID=A0AAE0HZT0_9PEZI|nr:hypothetical protein B0H66DRAFT_592158 [Apodospora peruviana]
MCILVKTFRYCYCKDRNDQICPHHRYLKEFHPEAFRGGKENLDAPDEEGWLIRSREDEYQKRYSWNPLEMYWEHCETYRDKHTKVELPLPPRLVKGFEPLCPETEARHEEKMKIHPYKLCELCYKGHVGPDAPEKEEWWTGEEWFTFDKMKLDDVDEEDKSSVTLPEASESAMKMEDMGSVTAGRSSSVTLDRSSSVAAEDHDRKTVKSENKAEPMNLDGAADDPNDDYDGDDEDEEVSSAAPSRFTRSSPFSGPQQQQGQVQQQQQQMQTPQQQALAQEQLQQMEQQMDQAAAQQAQQARQTRPLIDPAVQSAIQEQTRQLYQHNLHRFVEVFGGLNNIPVEAMEQFRSNCAVHARNRVIARVQQCQPTLLQAQAQAQGEEMQVDPDDGDIKNPAEPEDQGRPF